MPRLKLHFDGWLALPAHFRQQLALHAGDELEAELVGETVVLHKASSTRSPATAAVEETVAFIPTPTILATPSEEAPAAPVPPTAKRRGRPPKAKG
jgi:hypothetical protein